MVLEIEFHFGGCVLSGPDLSLETLKVKLLRVQRESGGNRDSFLEVLLDSFRWRAAPLNEQPKYCFDLDIGKLFAVKY